MRVLVGCEYSGTVRDAFIRAGHDAISVDLLPSESEGPHMQEDIALHLTNNCGKYDLIILHPPCTHMALCGNRWWAKSHERVKAVSWTKTVVNLALTGCNRVCVENPASVIFRRLRYEAGHICAKYQTQYIQPYQFGHPEQKKTGLALYNLPPLQPTKDVYEEMMKLPKKERERVFYMSPSDDRGKERARFYTGIAKAMADQWG